MALDLANILSKQRPFSIQFFQDGVVSLSVNGWGESTEEALKMLTQHVDELKAKLLLDTTDKNTPSK
jgi:hypothetical protein